MSGKKMSLRARIILMASIFMLATNLALGSALMQQSRRAMKTQINERMLDIVNTAAAMLDGDVLEKLRAEDQGTPEYEAGPANADPLPGQYQTGLHLLRPGRGGQKLHLWH